MEKKFSNQIIEQTKEGKEKDRTTFKKYNKERLDIKGRPMKIESKQGLRQKKRNQKVVSFLDKKSLIKNLALKDLFQKKRNQEEQRKLKIKEAAKLSFIKFSKDQLFKQNSLKIKTFEKQGDAKKRPAKNLNELSLQLALERNKNYKKSPYSKGTTLKNNEKKSEYRKVVEKKDDRIQRIFKQSRLSLLNKKNLTKKVEPLRMLPKGNTSQMALTLQEKQKKEKEWINEYQVRKSQKKALSRKEKGKLAYLKKKF